MSMNGKKTNYNEFIKHIKSELPKLKSVQFYYDTLYVQPLAGNYALATGPFHERTLDKDGKTEAYDVNLTWILIREANRYKLAYGTVFYQAVSP